MGSTSLPESDPRNPYHIPPTYFTPNANNQNGGPSSSSSAQPSVSRRLSSLPGRDGSQATVTESDMFRDADDDTGSGDYDLGRDLLGFDPPPPRSGPYQNPPQSGGQSSLASPYAPDRSRSYDNSNTNQSALSPFSQAFPIGSSSGLTSMASPNRDRLPSSNSVSSMSSQLKGNRAPAPAALDLSPNRDRTAKRNPYDGLGYGNPAKSTDGQRVLTDSSSSRPSARPLPLPPGAQHSSQSRRSSYVPMAAVDPSEGPSRSYRNISQSSSSLAPQGAYIVGERQSIPPSVPLSAVGDGRRRQESLSGQSMAPRHTAGPSIDSYYTRASPRTPSDPSLLLPQSSTTQTLSPASPGYIDPSDIDRRGLIGVGELATPRWAAQDWQRHSRVPSLPLQGASPSMPPPGHLPGGPAPQNWSTGETGLGLGVGMMEQVPEDSPAKDTRARHQSFSRSPQKPPLESRGSRTQPSTANDPDMDFASLLGSLDDFHFDSSMEAALAASLAIPDEKPDTGATASAVTSPTTSEGFRPFSSLPPQIAQPPPNTGSPGSARSRIYARRAEREQTRERGVAEQTSVPPPVQSPPHSADSGGYRRDSRKTPPAAKDKDIRHHQSPSHDILKHFAPKDFSHLPPSPSSASINQFLRGSNSTHNFATNGFGTGSTPPGISPSASYFGAPPGGRDTRDNRGSLPVSDMHKASASAWSQGVDPDTAEALRKLDGLGSTPGKSSKSKSSKTSTGPSSTGRPATPPKKTPPTHEKKLNPKTSFGSMKVEGEKDSPLNHWLDLGEDTQAVPIASPMRKLPPGNEQYGQEKRESSSSTSVGGTPNSRDSHSLPTSTTTPSSTPGTKVAGRRGSDGSVASQEAAGDKSSGEAFVPPVPPLPKGYMSMRQGLSAASYVPVQDGPTSNDTTPSSPGLGLTTDRPKQMNKKWSFSSALNLKLGKESPSSTTSPNTQESVDDSRSPDAPWSEIQKSELPSPYQRRPSEQTSLNDGRSNTSTTPVAPGSSQPQPPPLIKTTSGSKRLGPSSIPFFRRTSSSSSNQKPLPSSIAETPKSAGLQSSHPAQPPSSARKTGWGGMHLPSMLRGSVSKRGLSQQALPPVEIDEKRESVTIGSAGATGWTGRKRGKTMSMTAEQAQAIMMPPPSASTITHTVKPKASIESSLSNRDSAQSSRSETTINGGGTARVPKSALPAILGSPALKTTASSSSLRNDSRPNPSATPTKIPRIVSRQAEPGGSMPPPTTTSATTGSRTANWSARHMSNAASMNELARASITEFGTMAPRQPSSGSHRAHLLQPMSTRDVSRTKGPRTTEAPLRRADGTVIVVPPSRRTLPNPPGAAAATISSNAKRSSREFRPAGSRRESKETTDSGEKGSRDPSPIKPSKSLHAKLNLPSTAPVHRISPSSSLGAVGALNGTGFRSVSAKQQQQPSSGTASPADDEEALADNEMQLYIKRRRARAASSKKDDMADVIAFPEDTQPVDPTPQRTFIKQHLATLSEYERKEVFDYDNIYFSPSRAITRPVGSNGATYNHGFDDERGDYLVVEGDHMCYRYEVGHILGKGSFGQVVQARDHKTGQSVAIKIIRNKKRFHTQALVEVKILEQLCQWDPEDQHYMVRMTDHFYFRSHLCIVTELLSINLYELIKANAFAGFQTVLIRRFTVQMLASLQLMRSHRIVHCDLKPENILLCHPIRSGIKVIDFGSSCLETEKVYTYIQSRFYRSPEVILGMNYAMAIDMWSLGCILAELYTGVPIFPGENEHEQLACIMEIIGVPDLTIINRASRRKTFFDATGSPRPFVNDKGKRRRPSSKTLAQALKCQDELFVDFIAKCLTWDPDRRLKPGPAMRHPWIVAGRKRSTTSGLNDKRPGSSQIASRSFLPSSGSNGMSGKPGSSGKQLVISPPTPLVAKAPPPLTTSKIGHSISSSKLAQPMSRTGSFKTCELPLPCLLVDEMLI